MASSKTTTKRKKPKNELKDVSIKRDGSDRFLHENDVSIIKDIRSEVECHEYTNAINSFTIAQIHRQPIFVDKNEIGSPKWSKTNDNDENTCVTVKDDDDDPTLNFFGFDEMIEEKEEHEPNETRSAAVLPNKSDIKTRLKKLRKVPFPSSPKTTTERQDQRMQQIKTPAIFGESSGEKQPLIREMLTPTMIGENNTTALKQTAFNEETFNDDIDKFNIDLFEDAYNPETTFDTTKGTKTYSRSKAKQRNEFLFFSDDENEQQGKENIKKKHKKQTKKSAERYDNDEFERFAEQYNSMIELAESYEILIEIETTVVET